MKRIKLNAMLSKLIISLVNKPSGRFPVLPDMYTQLLRGYEQQMLNDARHILSA